MLDFSTTDGVEPRAMSLDGHEIWIGNRPGPGAPLLLLHGGLSNSRVWKAILGLLPADLDVWMYDRQGHGNTADADQPITYDRMVAEAVAVIGHCLDRPAHVVGHSDGANLGLLLAINYPAAVASLTAISANLNPDGISLSGFDIGEIIEAVRPDYAAISEDAVAALPFVASKIEKMWRTEPDIVVADLERISTPTMIVCADDDMIDLDHTIKIFRGVAGARFAVIPGSTHMQIVEKPELVASVITDFLPAS